MILTPNLLNLSETKKYYNDMSKSLTKYANAYKQANEDVNSYNANKAILANPTAYSDNDKSKASKIIANLQKESDYFEKLSVGQSANYANYAKSQGKDFDFSQISKNKNVLKEICKQYDDVNVQINKLNKSNKLLNQQRLAGQISDKKANEEIEINTDKVKNLTASQDALIAGTQEYNALAADTMKQTQAGASSYKKYAAEQRKNTLATIGQTVAQTALNMAITAGVSALVTIAINAMSDFVDELFLTKKEAEELAEEIHSKFQELNCTLQKNSQIVKDNTKRYEKLAKGVNALGKNVSLTDEEFAEYNNISNTIAEQFPNLVTGYTDTGDAILSCKNNLTELNAELEKQNKLTQDQMIVNSGEAVKAYNTQYNKGNVNFGSITSGIFDGFRRSVDIFKTGKLPTTTAGITLSGSDFASSKTYTEQLKDLESIFKDNSSLDERNAKIEEVLGSYKSLANGQLKLKSLLTDANYDVSGLDSIDDMIKIVTEDSSQLSSRYNVMVNEIATANQQLITEAIMPRLQYSDKFKTMYSSLNDEQQEITQSLIGLLDINKVISDNEFGNDSNALTEWINENVVKKIYQSGSGVQAAYKDILALNISEMPYEEYMQQLDALLLELAQGIGGDVGQQIADNIRNGMGAETEDEYEQRKKDFTTAHSNNNLSYSFNPSVKVDWSKPDESGKLDNYNEAIADAFDKLTEEQQYKLDIILKPDFNFDSTDAEEVYKQMIDILEKAKVKEYNEKGFKFTDYSEDFKNVQESVAKYKTAYQTVKEAKESAVGTLSEEDKVSLLSDIPDLAPYIDNVDALEKKLFALSQDAVTPLSEELTNLADNITDPQTKEEILGLVTTLQAYVLSVTNNAKTASEAMADLKTAYEPVQAIKEAIAKDNDLTADELSSIANLSPELSKATVEYINGDSTIDNLLTQVQNYYETVKSENIDSLTSINQAMIDSAIDAYGVDISNCANYAEAKKKILTSIYTNTSLGKDTNGNDYTLDQFYDMATGQFTDLYISMQKSGGETSRDIIKAVNKYVQMIEQGTDLAIDGIEEIDVDGILSGLFEQANLDIIEMQKNVADLQHQLAMGWISQDDFDEQYADYLAKLQNKLKGQKLSESDQSTVDSFEETNHSQLQANEERTYDTVKKDIDNNLADKLIDPRTYFDKLASLADTYYGENGTIDDPDGTKYKDKQREILEQRSTLYDQEVEQLKKDYESGMIKNIDELTSKMNGSTEYWLSGIPELADTYKDKVKEVTSYLYDQEVDLLDKSKEKGTISATQYARDLIDIWDKYYKDKDGYRQEDYEAEKAVNAALREGVQSQIDGIESLIDDNSDFYQAQIDAIEDSNDKIEEQYDAQIKVIEDKITAIEDTANAEDKYLAVLEAEDALEKARNQRNVAHLNANGAISYVADNEDIAEKEKTLKEANKDYEVDKLEQEKEALEKEKETLTDTNDKKIKELNDTLTKVNTPLEALVKILQATVQEHYGLDEEFINQILNNNPDAIKAFDEYNKSREQAGLPTLSTEDLKALVSDSAETLAQKTTTEQQNQALQDNATDSNTKENKHWNWDEAYTDNTWDWEKYKTLYNTPITTDISDNVMAANKQTYNPQDIQGNDNIICSIGDIIINTPVGDTDELAKAIQEKLPNKVVQRIHKKNS